LSQAHQRPRRRGSSGLELDVVDPSWNRIAARVGPIPKQFQLVPAGRVVPLVEPVNQAARRVEDPDSNATGLRELERDSRRSAEWIRATRKEAQGITCPHRIRNAGCNAKLVSSNVEWGRSRATLVVHCRGAL